jgi:YHS domain-containing protein
MIDPVCGKRMNRCKAHIVVEYEGVAYALCCPLCQAEFERSPATYARPGWGRRVKRERRADRQNHLGRRSG